MIEQRRFATGEFVFLDLGGFELGLVDHGHDFVAGPGFLVRLTAGSSVGSASATLGVLGVLGLGGFGATGSAAGASASTGAGDSIGFLGFRARTLHL